MLPAGIAVISLVGPDAMRCLRAIFQPRSPRTFEDWPSDRLRIGRVIDGDEVIDDAVVAARIEADGTGHVEINVHGGPRIVQRVLLALQRQGAAVVSAEEMAGDAWPAADAIEREVYEHLPRAQTRRVLRWLLGQRGHLPAEIGRVRSLFGTDPHQAIDRARALLATFPTAGRMLSGFSVAIAGPPNAGKSTLANALCGRLRAIVSDLPGTTRDYVCEPVAIEGIPILLTDTAGLRTTDDPVEAEAIRRARQQARQADLRLLVLDAAEGPTAEGRALLHELAPSGPLLIVWNKIDLLSGASAARAAMPTLASSGLDTEVSLSAARGDGMDLLRERIAIALGVEPGFDGRPAVFTPRQKDLLARAVAARPKRPEEADRPLQAVLE